MLDRERERRRRTHRSADEVRALEAQCLDERGEVRGFDEHRMVGRGLRILIGVVVAAAVRDDVVVARERRHLRFPRAVVALPAVQEDHGFAGAGADVVQLDAIDDDLRGFGERGMRRSG